jgi:glutaredoxin
VEYGDFECPYCDRAEPVVRELLADYGDLRYVWRHLPLTDVHPHAQAAAEAAASQGTFWEMHDQLLDHQDALTTKDLIRYAAEVGLNTEQFARDLRDHAGQAKIAADVDSADLSGVSGTPTFFINGKRHHGAYDIATLSSAVRAARARALISPPSRPPRPSRPAAPGHRMPGSARPAPHAASSRHPRVRRLGARSPRTVSVTYCDGSPEPGLGCRETSTARISVQCLLPGIHVRVASAKVGLPPCPAWASGWCCPKPSLDCRM